MSTEQRANGRRRLTAVLTGPARRICGMAIDPIRRPRRRACARRLAELDDRLLRDIGLTRPQAHAAAYGLLRLREPSPPAPVAASRPGDPAVVVRLTRRAIAVRVRQPSSAQLGRARNAPMAS